MVRPTTELTVGGGRDVKLTGLVFLRVEKNKNAGMYELCLIGCSQAKKKKKKSTQQSGVVAQACNP